MSQESLSYKTLRNSSYYFTGFLLPILAGVIVLRIVVRHLGVAEYGVLVLTNTVTAFLGYIDLGFGTAFTKFAAEYHARKDVSALRTLIHSVQSVSFIFGIVGFVIFVILGKWFLPLFHIQPQSLGHIFMVFTLAGIVFLINTLTIVPLGVTTALQRFDIITKVNVLNLVIVNTLTVAVVTMGYQLKAILLVNIFTVFVVFFIYRQVYMRLLPEVRLQFGWDVKEIKKAYKFGLLTFVSSFAAGALVFLDRLVIPIFINPAQLSYYSVPGNVALKTPGITNSLSVMLFPMASSLQGSGEEDKMKDIYVRAFRNLSIVSAAVTTGIVLFARPILFFWLGEEFANRGTAILVILAITNYMISLYIPLQSMLLGLGKLTFLIKQSVGMAVLNLALLLVLVPRFGILGAAWAYLISILPMVYAFYWVEQRHFLLGHRLGYYVKFYLKLLVTALATAVLAKFALLPWVKSIYGLIICGPLSVLCYLMFYYIFHFADSQDMATFKYFFSRIYQNFFDRL